MFANLKKGCFYQKEVCFLGYVISSQGIHIEEKRINVVKVWPEPKSVQNIQVFIRFANFYRRFIQGFSKITALLISILKTSPQPADALPATGVDDSEVIRSSGRNEEKLAKSDFTKPVRRVEEPSFLTPDARQAFTQLRQAFTEAPILRHFDPERHIRIETDASGYAIGGVLSQMTSEIGQWHPVAYYLRKMISAETRYETHDAKLLAIVEAFKNWRHYLEGCQYEVLVLTDHNNLRRFMDTKSLSSRQVRWAQELSRYHFHIDYC